MPAEGFEAFQQLVLNDAALQEELLSSADERTLFGKAILLGQERGYSFSEDELAAAVRRNRRNWLERWLYQ